jgi:hypothetical protein
MRNLTLVALLLFITALTTGCDSDGGNDDALALGEFIATTTGDVDDQLRGDAVFALSPYSPSQEMLSLRLQSGTFQPPGRPYDMDLGVFLNVSWEGQPGSFAVPTVEDGPVNSTLMLPSDRTFGFPTLFRVESGTVTVVEAAAERVSGTFEVVAVDVPALEVDGVRYEVRARGEFVAEPAPEE